jgi:hypothetical protein
LYEPDCKSSYTKGNVILALETPYMLTAKNRVVRGYKDSVCLKCISSQKIGNTANLGAQTLTKQLTVTQSSKCLGTLKIKEIPLGPLLNLNHDSP